MSYGKVHDAYWESETIDALSDRAALLGLFLISGPHRNAIGCFKLGTGAITDNPRFGGWGIEGVSNALRELIDGGFIQRDARTGWTYVCNALKHDPIQGWKPAIHAVKLFAAVPKNLPFYSELRAKLTAQIEDAKTTAKDWKDIAGYPFDTPSIANRSPLPSPLPEPEPSPEPQPAASRFDARYGEAVKRCEEALGEKAATCLVWGRVNAWLVQGADIEGDIVPVLKARVGKWRGKSLEYFDDAIADAIATRMKPLPQGTAKPPDFDPLAHLGIKKSGEAA